MRFTIPAGLLVATLLLVACGGAAPTSAPTTAPAAATSAPAVPTAALTEEPTAPAAATAAPTSEPTAEPAATAAAVPTGEAAAGVLPAPLYANIGGQVVRVERDGATQTPISREPSAGDALAMTDFAVSAKDGALAYVVQKPGGGTALVGTDAQGENRTVLFDRADAGASRPQWSPDGTTIAVGVTEFAADGAIAGGGLYLIPAAGGDPQLVQANSTLTTTATTDFDPDAVGYYPISFSPDGSRILAARYSLQVELCELAIVPVAGGDPVRMRSPDPALRPTCGPATWSTDSSAVYTGFAPADGIYTAIAGLWRVDAATGEATPVVPASADGKQQVVRDPAYLRAGEISALVGSADRLPQIGDEVTIPYQMVRIEAGSGQWSPLRPEMFTDAQQIAWAPDASGAIVQTLGENGRSTLVWYPADGSPSTPVAEGVDLSGFAWGAP
jgi:dipeptidyl aminopeptidase/acylaminoacyl peptidase